MGEFNSNDHYMYSMDKNPFMKWSRPHSQQESPKCSKYLGAISKTAWSQFISKANYSTSQ